MKKKHTLLMLVFFLAFLFGCDKTKAEQIKPIKVSADEALRLIKEEKATLVDVRTEAEYVTGYIEKAILIPNESISSSAVGKLPDKDVPIIVYCRSGRRSNEAAGKLIKLGYTKIYDLGGILSWPYEIVK